MINASKIIVCILLICGVSVYFAQKDSSRLKQEQDQLEQQIASTKALLQASQANTSLSLEELNLVNQQVKNRERLLRNYDNQIRRAELKIKEKNNGISALQERIVTLKAQYKSLLIYAYKKRSKYGKLMYIFSSKSVEEARKRKLYLEKLAEIQKKQLKLITQNQALLSAEIEELKVEKTQKEVLLGKKKDERAVILKEKERQQAIYNQLKAEEQGILASLKDKEKKRQQIEQRIKKAIEKELREEQARLEKARKEAERKRKEAERRRKEKESTVATEEESVVETPAPFLTTKEEALLGKSFSQNRGRLPWPVEKGTITENYGKNPHPTLNNVFTNNNGVDISTPKNALVRCVYQGEVTSVLNISGAGKVVIVKHGNYRTVYANLQEVYVTKGVVLSTKSPVGSLLPNRDGTVSVVHFEIHEVTDTGVQRLNPNLWIAQ